MSSDDMFKSWQISKLLDELKNIGNTPVVVEGIKDKKPLKEIGFSNVIDISGQPLNDVVERISAFNHKDVIILTDFDHEGQQKASQLSKFFASNGIKVNSFIRHKIRSLLKIHKIEEINSFTKLLGDGHHGKIGSIHDKIFNRSRILKRRNCGKT